MSAFDIIRILIIGVGVPIIVYLLWRIARRLRDIRQRIEEVRAEEDEIRKNPYAAMARLLEEQEARDRLFAAGRGRSPDAAKRDR